MTLAVLPSFMMPGSPEALQLDSILTANALDKATLQFLWQVDEVLSGCGRGSGNSADTSLIARG